MACIIGLFISSLVLVYSPTIKHTKHLLLIRDKWNGPTLGIKNRALKNMSGIITTIACSYLLWYWPYHKIWKMCDT